jgi:hypothetical protein
MAARFIALIGLCLVFIAHGIPVSIKISPPAPHTDELRLIHQGSKEQLNGGGFEGDMIFPKGFNPKSSARGVAIYGNRQWPSHIIPYDLSAITDTVDQKKITDAMNTLMYAVGTPIENSNQRTACVYFRPRQSTDKVYLKVQYGNGCSANVGYMTNYQPTMTLQKNSGPYEEGCFYTQVIQHELMHVLGFYHEQSRPDRDDYLQINLENVESNMVHNFNKYEWGLTVHDQDTTYDYSSIMHYGTTAFSMNGKPTMVPRQTGANIGDALALSPIDINEVRNYYTCAA